MSEGMKMPPGAIPMPPGAVFSPRETTVKHEPVGESALEIVGGAMKDTLALGRPEADVLGRAVHQPKNMAEAAVREAIMAPITAVSLPLRVGASAASGLVAALGSGRSLGDAGWAGALDLAVAGLTEGTLAGAGKLAGKVGARTRGFEFATRAPAKALEAIRARLPAGKWLNVPSLGTAKMTVDEAVEKLAKTEGATYRQARAEIAAEMNRLDAQKVTGPKPLAGAVWKDQTSKKRFADTPLSRVAEAAHRGLDSGVARGAADIAATTPIDEGQLPAGLLTAIGAASAPSHVLRHVPGLGRVLDAVPAQ